MDKNKWYVVHTYSGYEEQVKGSIIERLKAEGLQDRVGEILVPTEQVVEIRSGKRRVSSRKFFPGYLLIEMALDQETWYLVKNTPKVTGFLGSEREPSSLTDEEVEGILEQVREQPEKPKHKVSFEKGEKVRVLEGPFTNFSGVIGEVNEERGKLRVMVSIFGRATPVELEFLQVEKV
jgi:transcriptional antiterminator NusG